MRRTGVALVALLVALGAALPAAADDRDTAGLGTPLLRIGERTTLTIEVYTGPGSTVEVDPAAPSWSGVEVVRIASQVAAAAGGEQVHRLEIVVAPFEPGDREVVPVVNVVTGAEVENRALPMVPLRVEPSLAPNAELELSELPAPAAIPGAESPFLRPAIGAGIVAGVLVLGALAYLVVRRLARAKPALPPEAEPVPIPSLDGAARLIESDPVGAYRTLAATVRNFIANRYGLPAQALTTGEIQRRMEAQGVDRWQARLVGGLLEECDSVVYAGYRPASERRAHDLTMAREIVEAS